jgi:tRNA(Ile)-lysidine synthase TilS/MesJ
MKITDIFFENFLNKNYIFESQPKIAVAVSGGPDSMALVFLLNKWVKKNKVI